MLALLREMFVRAYHYFAQPSRYAHDRPGPAAKRNYNWEPNIDDPGVRKRG